MAANQNTPRPQPAPLKRCKKCGSDKPLDDFHKHRGSPDGKSGSCKICDRERSKAWSRANPERVKTTRRAYGLANRQMLSRANAEKVKVWSKADRSRRKEAIAEQKRKWSETNSAHVKEQDKQH